jgi:hypothetical protein
MHHLHLWGRSLYFGWLKVTQDCQINTTERATFLKISTTDSVQADLADGSGLAMPRKHRKRKIEIGLFLM